LVSPSSREGKGMSSLHRIPYMGHTSYSSVSFAPLGRQITYLGSILERIVSLPVWDGKGTLTHILLHIHRILLRTC